MPKITVTIFGASIELEDDKMTATTLATLAMRKLHEAAAIRIDQKSVTSGVAGFHTDTPAPKPEPYAIPFTAQPEARKR